ncbi:MAG: hypothetical protein L6R41_007715 [Letrouitia leprolyta]|nr:MAG: hypothetical protein L6R41_007715 [Letrouitia leprolyta]
MTLASALYEPFGPDGTSYNASGSYPVLGFQEPGNRTTPSNWTYNYAVLADKDGTSWNTIWIETSGGEKIGSPDRPYVGCVSVYFGLPQSTNKRGQDDNGDCRQTFDGDCVSAILTMAHNATEEKSRNGADAQAICTSSISMQVPKECRKYTDEDYWTGGSSLAIGNSTYSNDTDIEECSLLAKGANNGIFGWDMRGSSNATGYDEAVTRILPVLTTVWLKERESKNDSAPWADSRLTCMTGRDIQTGSKKPKGVPSLGVKVSTGGFIWEQAHINRLSGLPNPTRPPMAQYYPQSSQPYNPQQNLNFYQSSYAAPVSGHSTPSQAQYPYSSQNSYGQPSSNAYGASSSFGGFGGAGAPGVSGRMGEQGGLRTGWLAAFGTEGYEGEPPLLEELGVNFGHIKGKTLTVLNPLAPISQHIMDDSDLAGPILFFLLFGTFLLFSGKVHFGYIYGLALWDVLCGGEDEEYEGVGGVSVGVVLYGVWDYGDIFE